MKRNKKFRITGHCYNATIEIKFKSENDKLFAGEAETKSDEIFKKVLKGITEIGLDIAIGEKKR